MAVPRPAVAAGPLASALFFHGTTVDAALAPLYSFDECCGELLCDPSYDNGPFATFGALAAASMGLLGLGADAGSVQGYLIAETYAVTGLELYAAAAAAFPAAASRLELGEDECGGHADCAPRCLYDTLSELANAPPGVAGWSALTLTGVALGLVAALVAAAVACSRDDRYEAIA